MTGRAPLPEDGPAAAIAQARAARARHLLTRPGARLVPGTAGWSLQTRAEGRARVLMHIDAPTFDQLARLGVLRVTSDGGYSLARTASPTGGLGPQSDGLPPSPPGSGVPRRRPRALDWLAARTDAQGRPWLTPAQLQAAHRLERDFERASAAIRLTRPLAPAPGAPVRHNAGDDRFLPGVEARARIVRALSWVAQAEPQAVSTLQCVCLEQMSLAGAAARLGLPTAEVRRRLQRALARLAAHDGG